MAYNLAGILSLRDKDFTSTIKKASKQIDNFENKMKHVSNQIKRLERTVTKRFISMAKEGAGFAAGALGVYGAGSLFSSALSGAADLEGYRNTLNAVMKDQKKAAQTMKWAVEFANKTPFETGDIVQATVRLQSYGIEAQKVLPIIGDMAGVMGKDIMQAVEAVADAQTGELERLKEFGITKQMIVDHANKIMRGKQIVNNKGQITDQENFNKALFSLMNERFKGGMEIQANSFRGIMSTITGVFKTSLATMMGVSATGEVKAGSLFDTIKKKAKLMADTLTKWSEDGTLERVGNRITSILNGIGTAIGWVKQNSDWLIPVLSGLAASIATLKIIGTVRKLMLLWKASTIAQIIAQGGLNVVLMANPIGLIAAAIGLVVAAGVALYKNWDTVKKKAQELWDKIRDIWGKIKEFFKNPIKGTVEVTTASKAVRKNAPARIPRFAAGINRVPRDMLAVIHKDEAVVPAKYNPFNPNAKGGGSRPVVININGTNKSTDEIINEMVPKLKLALANM